MVQKNATYFYASEKKNEIGYSESVIHFVNIPPPFFYHDVLHRGTEAADSVGEGEFCGGPALSGKQ